MVFNANATHSSVPPYPDEAYKGYYRPVLDPVKLTQILVREEDESGLVEDCQVRLFRGRNVSTKFQRRCDSA
ncbi:hypothetical protein PG993_012574 [Apiospora rasikravindrae]|uniref:Uncharacterized protein n=1 Tax=Apiospora rasikravindrae TaxID=990691 RepID=A0ABR1S302_9PEZI